MFVCMPDCFIEMLNMYVPCEKKGKCQFLITTKTEKILKKDHLIY